jgi:hypothetical protein
MWLLYVAVILALFYVAVWLWGKDSRPGFSDGRTNVKERWFFHSRRD